MEPSNGLFCCNLCDMVRKRAPNLGYSNLIGYLMARYLQLGNFFLVSERLWFRITVDALKRGLKSICHGGGQRADACNVKLEVNLFQDFEKADRVCSNQGASLEKEMGQMVGLMYD
ncbi:hypothetical protein GN244_ATG13787 [Phytophthora infestans]|uniref:Uncharacterized protein n=1 Tax=Phytophthora infestans TaxID=4787 RepID=A0A833WQW9_PHYIN|nr:hypothetical protein GN244_ATG13787 [Phytophthora infestans]